jgi:hypothetical protein
MQEYFGVAKDEGGTNAEIGAAQSIAMAVSAERVSAQFREARIKARRETHRKDKG